MIHPGILTSTDIGMAKKGIGGLKTADTSLWLRSRKGLPKRRSSFLQLKSCELLEFRRKQMVKRERHQIGKGADEEYNGVASRDVAGGRELVQQEAADDRENHSPS